MDSRLTIMVLWLLLGFICLSCSQVQEETNLSCTCMLYHKCNLNQDTTEYYGENVIEPRITAEEAKCSHYLDICCFPENGTTPLPTPVGPVDPTPVGPVDPTPIGPVDPTPVGPVAPTPVGPVVPTPVGPVDSTPVGPVDPTPIGPVDPTPIGPIEPQEDTCGERNPDGVGLRITGGSETDAAYGEFPWMVAVIKRGWVIDNTTLKAMECAGTIIHPKVILTVAHCVRRKPELFIRAGEWNTQGEEMIPNQERNVKEVIIHNKYYAGDVKYDIALLVLEQPLKLNRVVGKLCLPNQDENMDGINCVVSGWGKDSYGRRGKYQAIMRWVNQTVVRKEPCQEAMRTTDLGPNFMLHESIICAGGVVGQDACQGDGGGALACPSKDDKTVYVQAGIVSFSLDCGKGIPALYTNVPHLKNWIDKELTLRNLA